jgi:hypothetical protein
LAPRFCATATNRGTILLRVGAGTPAGHECNNDLMNQRFVKILSEHGISNIHA